MEKIDNYPDSPAFEAPHLPFFPGIHGAFPLLFDKYWNRLVRFAASLTGGEEQGREIVQQVLVNCLLKGMALRNEAHLYTYLCRSVRNCAINEKRNRITRYRHLQILGSTTAFGQEFSDDVLVQQDLRRLIAACLTVLPLRYSDVFLLFWEQGMTVREVSVALNRPESTVEKQLRKARHCLRANFDESLLRQ